jgi:hypothetical protein
MDGELPLLPDKGLQSLLLRQVVRELPRFTESPLWPLPPEASLQCFDAAVALFCTGTTPVLSPAKVWSALCRSDLPVFDLATSTALQNLAPEQVCTMMADYLIAHSDKCSVERFDLRTSHIASARATKLFLRLLRSLKGHSSPIDFSLRGGGGFSGGVARHHMREIAIALGAVPLRALKVPGMAAVDDELLGVMLDGTAGDVETLDIAMCSATSSGIASIFVDRDLGIRHSLRDLDLSGTSIDSSGVLALTGIERLERLSLAWTPVVRPRGRLSQDGSVADLAEAGVLLGTVLASLTGLRRLDLSGATIDLGGPVLSGVRGVRELILASARIDHRTGRMMFAERLPAALQILDLSAVCGTASVLRMLQAVGERVGGTIEDINLAHCELRGWDVHEETFGGQAEESFHTVFDGVAEMNLVQLFNSSLHALRVLDLSHTGGISERTLVLMFVGEGFLYRLVKLSMRGLRLPKFALRLRQWANVGVEYSLPALESLDLSDTALADSPPALTWLVASLLTDASNLRTLSLSGARCLTYDVVGKALEKTADSIVSLDVSFCPFPSTGPGNSGHDVLARQAAQVYPSLRSANLTGCGALPESMVAILMQKAPNLEVVVADDGAIPPDACIGKEQKRRAFGVALAHAAMAEQHAYLALHPWRVRT